MKDFNAAKDDMTKAMEVDPKDPKTAKYVNARAYIHYWLGENDLAVIDSTQAITLDPHAAGAYNNRGLVRQAQNELDAALDDFGKAVEIEPKNGIYYANRGWIRGEKGEFADAVADMAKAVDLCARATVGLQATWRPPRAARGSGGRHR